jgi:hypothetical protein
MPFTPQRLLASARIGAQDWSQGKANRYRLDEVKQKFRDVRPLKQMNATAQVPSSQLEASQR